MPTVSNISGPYRFFFYSFDCNERMHVHVQRERMVCKFWIQPLALAKNQGFASKELYHTGDNPKEQRQDQGGLV